MIRVRLPLPAPKILNFFIDFRMQIIVNGLAVEYADEGRGRILLLLHGWGDNLHTFDFLAKILSQNMRVIRLDLPGFGKSETPPNAWHVADYVAFVAEFLRKIGVGSAGVTSAEVGSVGVRNTGVSSVGVGDAAVSSAGVGSVDFIAGHSFGGRIIIKGIASRGFSAEKIILISSAGVARRGKMRAALWKFFAKAGSAAMRMPPLNAWRGAARKKLYSRLGSDYASSGAGALKGTYLNIINEDLAPAAEQIKTPALLIWGEKDDVTPLEEGERLSKLISGSRLKVLRGAGHFVHREQPREVAQYMSEFIFSSEASSKSSSEAKK